MSSEIKVKDELVDPEYEKIASGEIQVKSEPQDFPDGFFDVFENNQFLDELVGTLEPELDGNNDELQPTDDILSSTNPPPPAESTVAAATKKSPIRAPAANDADDFLLESDEAAMRAEIENLTRTIERRKATLRASNIKLEKVSPPRDENRNRSPSPFTRRIKRERITPQPEPQPSTSWQLSHTGRHSPSPRHRSRSPEKSRSPRRRLSRSPDFLASRKRSRSPVNCRSPRRRSSRSPVRSSSRRRSSRSPVRSSSRRRSRSPVSSSSRRRSSRSPVRSSSRRRSRSPEKRRSPMRRKSRSPPPRWRRSRSPALRRRSSSRERAIRADQEFQKERQRLLELIQAKKASDAALEEHGVEDMDLETTNMEKTNSVPKEPTSLRVMPKLMIIKTEPIDSVEVITETPPAKRIKTEEVEEVPLSHRDRVLKFCTDTLKNFELFQRSIRKKRRFLYTPTLLVRKSIDDQSLQENRSPLNHGIGVQYPFSSVRMNVDTEKFGICKVGDQTAKIVSLLGYNANEFVDRLNPNSTSKLNRDVPDELISAESTFYADAETQTSELKCNKCIIRKLTKRIDKAVQISLQPIESSTSMQSSYSSFDSNSNPMYDFVSHLLPAQCTAIKEFVQLIKGPAPSNIEDRAKVRETLIDIFTVAQSQSNKQPFEQPSSPTINTSSRYNQSIPNPALQMQQQSQTNSIYGSGQPQPVPSPYQQHIPVMQQPMNHIYQQPNNIMQQPRFYPPPINHVPQSHVPQSHVRPPPQMLGGLPHMQSNYHHRQPPGIVPQMRSRFPSANMRPMRSDDPRTARYTSNIELGPPPPPKF